MRLLIAGLAMMVSIILLCAANQIYLKSCLEAVINDIGIVAGYVENEEWESASEKLASIMDAWFEKKGYYMSVILHDHIDDAEAAIVELQSHIDSQSLPEAKKAANEVQVRLQQLIFEETLSLANLL
jgi:hypothetical protein